MSAEMIIMDEPSKRPPIEPHPRRCTAHKRNGDPCGRWAIMGGTVCPAHGGRSPQVKHAARIRLMNLIEPAITVLATEMEVAENSADRQRAANSILDRAGLIRGNGSDAEVLRALLIDRLRTLQAGEG